MSTSFLKYIFLSALVILPVGRSFASDSLDARCSSILKSKHALIDLFEKSPKLEKLYSLRSKLGNQPDSSVYGKLRNYIATVQTHERIREAYSFGDGQIGVGGHVTIKDGTFHFDILIVQIQGGALRVSKDVSFGDDVPFDKFAFTKLLVAILEGLEIRAVHHPEFNESVFEIQGSKVGNYLLCNLLAECGFENHEGTKDFKLSFLPTRD